MASRYSGSGTDARRRTAVAKVNAENRNHMNSKPLAGNEDVTAKSSAGLNVFKISDMDYLRRFLITGTTGSYYIHQQAQMSEHISFLQGIAKQNIENGLAAVDMIVQISQEGRSVKNDSALFALAVMCDSSWMRVRQKAFAAIPQVARTATHLFMFMGFVRELRGLGRGIRNAINGWYLNREPTALAYQIAKYRNREGWTHRDVLRLTRPKVSKMTGEQSAIIDYAVHPDNVESLGNAAAVSPVISAYEEMKRLPNNKEGKTRGIELIDQFNLPHEVVPNDWKKDSAIWEALITHMKPEALMRNLGRMTSLGMFTGVPGVRNREIVRNTFSEENIKRARLHPLKIYIALKMYRSGSSRGGLSWTADKEVLNALETAFYASFKYGDLTGADIYIGLDISGSMQYKCYTPDGRTSGQMWYQTQYSAQDPSVSCFEAEAIMTRALAATGNRLHVGAFCGTLTDVTHMFQGAAMNDKIETTVEKLRKLHMGCTNLSLPIKHALTEPSLQKRAFDAFVIFTDNEVNQHDIHPQKLIMDYRQKVGKATRFIVVGMVANKISIASPHDPFMMDIGGFDANLPKLVSEFIQDWETK